MDVILVTTCQVDHVLKLPPLAAMATTMMELITASLVDQAALPVLLTLDCV